MGNGAVAISRLMGAGLIMSALGVQAWADLTYGTFTWVQLPGYFTPLAATSGIVALLAAAITGPSEPRWVALLRVNAATYLLIAGGVYWALLGGVANPLFPWANAVLHGGAGLMLLVDWMLVGTRTRLPMRTLWSALALPAVWLGYLGVRAIVDGWVPYPFLDPARGIATVGGTLLVIAAIGLSVAAILHTATPLRVIRPRMPATGQLTTRASRHF